MIWFGLKLLVTMVAARFGAARDEDNEEGISVSVLGQIWLCLGFIRRYLAYRSIGQDCYGHMWGWSIVSSWPQFRYLAERGS
jgi:hypothetical protein